MKKSVLIAGALALVCSGAFADDFDDFGSFDDFGDFGSGSSGSAGVTVSGKAGVGIRDYVDADDANEDDVETAVTIDGKLGFEYSGSKSDINLVLNMNSDIIKNHPEDVIDELTMRGYFGNFVLEGGKMKVVWGKGDKLHVLDNFNADDYADFIIPDYIDRRISTPMVRGTYNIGVANLQLEGVYTPFLPVDRFATEGRWTPAQVSALTSAVTNCATDKVAVAFTHYTTDTAAYGALSTMNANLLAARTANETAIKTLNDVTAAYTGVYAKLYQGALANGLSAADAKTYADSKIKDSYIAFMKTLNPAYDSDYEKDCAAAKDAIAATSFDLKEAEGVLTEALKELGCKDLDEAKDRLTKSGTDYMTALMMANALTADPALIYPDTTSWKYGQFGARLTGTVGQFDWGVSYYNGYYKQPSFNADKMESWVTKYLADEVTEEDKFLAYDRKQTFGLEGATTLWHFNLRGEAGYNLTEDVDGTDPWVHNNSICWLGGFDIDLPFWNMNVNIQETGTFILHGDECDSNVLDVDYAVNGYSNNKLVANVTTSFLNDKLVPEVTVMYGIENGDVVVLPKLTYSVADGLSLNANGMYIWNRDDNSEFAAWKANSFVAVGVNYQF